MPGASCCTIYQLPPGGTWLIDPMIFENVKAIASVEVHATSGWQVWEKVAADIPKVTVSNQRLTVTDSLGYKDAKVTGRVTVRGEGVFNLVVNVKVKGSNGWDFLQARVACAKPGRAYAFEASTFAGAPKSPKIDRIWAVTTTIPGVGDVSQPPGCD